MSRIVPLLLLLTAVGAFARPEIFYNVYRHTPRVEIVPGRLEQLSPEESDRQYRTIADLSGGFRLTGSSFFVRNKTVFSNVPPVGLVGRVFPDMRSVLRIWAAFRRRGQNYLAIRFNKPLPIPRWTESLEFWSLEYGAKRKYRLVYTDAGGKEFFLNFRMQRKKGWARYSANIPIRRAAHRPFSYRYQQLYLKGLILLDDFAGKKRKSIYHIAAIGASRKVITPKNRSELWKFRKSAIFNSRTIRQLRIRHEGVSNFTATAERETNNSTPFLRIRGRMQEHGITRIRIRFPEPIRIQVCRKLLIQLRADSQFDRILLLAATDRKKYYLMDFNTVQFNIWRKLEMIIPPWIVQHTGQTTSRKGLLLHEILIVPIKKRWKKRIAVDIAWIGAVYDRDINFLSRQRQFKIW